MSSIRFLFFDHWCLLCVLSKIIFCCRSIIWVLWSMKTYFLFQKEKKIVLAKRNFSAWLSCSVTLFYYAMGKILNHSFSVLGGLFLTSYSIFWLLEIFSYPLYNIRIKLFTDLSVTVLSPFNMDTWSCEYEEMWLQAGWNISAVCLAVPSS